jgi:hypothetical protein
MIRHNHQEDIKSDSEKAVLVIYRSTSFAFSSKVNTFLDDKFIGQTIGKCYFTTKAEPGNHYLIMISGNKTCTQLNLEAGSVYYILQTIYPGNSSVQCGFSESDPEKFSKEIPELEYLTVVDNKELPQLNKSDFEETCLFGQQKEMLTLKH